MSVLKKSAGPCVAELDKVLNEMHVERQAYHGKSFVGNHVHKMLKVNIFILYMKWSLVPPYNLQQQKSTT